MPATEPSPLDEVFAMGTLQIESKENFRTPPGHKVGTEP